MTNTLKLVDDSLLSKPLWQFTGREFLELLTDNPIKTNQAPVTIHSPEDPATIYLTRKEAKTFVRMSQVKFDSLVKAGKIKRIPSTEKRVLFCKQDLIDYLEACRK